MQIHEKNVEDMSRLLYESYIERVRGEVENGLSSFPTWHELSTREWSKSQADGWRVAASNAITLMTDIFQAHIDDKAETVEVLDEDRNAAEKRVFILND